jgi:hypothetical protein
LVEAFERHCEAAISDDEVPGMTVPPPLRRNKRR